MTVDAADPPIAYPTKRDEAWRYAPHGALQRLVFGPPPASPIDLPAEIQAQIPLIDGPRIVVINGVVDLDRSDLTDLPQGLHLTPLALGPDAPESEPGPAPPASDSDAAADAFLALARAWGRDGARIRVDGHCDIGRPIQVVDVAVPGEAPNVSCTRVVIDLGEASSATVVETHIGAHAGFGGSATRSSITIGAGSTLTHVVLQDAPDDQIQLAGVEVHQHAESEFRGRSFNLGAHYGRIDYRVALAGEGATTDLAGLYFGFGDQTLDQQITVVHEAGHCISRQAFRGVLDDRSTGVFNGGIIVRPGADGTEAEQANDNLLLSTQADANTQPRLEILADDVACRHGATVGQLDDDALYYLRSRGIAADEARQLLIAGFADQTVDLIEIDAVRSWIIERLGHGHA